MIEFGKMVPCPNCAGYGTVPMCSECNGEGQMMDIITFKMNKLYMTTMIAPHENTTRDTLDTYLSFYKSVLAIEFDFENIKGITGNFAKILFGGLYHKLGNQNFFTKVYIKNAEPNVIAMIRLGISNSVLINEST